MSGETAHNPQLLKSLRTVPWYAALGGLIGAIIGALIMWFLFHCGCPVGK